ncbi:MAG: alpha/beta fold hydrolase [Promethearchaeota archaeon]
MDWLKEIEEKYISVNGITLHTIIIGSGEPLLLLHGFPDFWYGWKNIIPMLKDDFELIIPDLRGFNLSDKPKGIQKYRIELLVDDIYALSEKLNLGSFFLAGHDWGAVISWAFAEKYPKKVKKLAILNGPHPKIFQEKLRTDKDQQKASFYIFEFLKPDGEKFLYENDYKWLKWAVFEGLINKKDFTEFDKQKYLDAWSQPNAILSGVNYYRANLNFDNLTGIISVPTLIIHGMQDKAVLPQVLDGISEYVKDVTVVKIDASHWVMHDKPELIVANFQKFFKT